MTEEIYLERTNLLFDCAVQTINCSRSGNNQLKAGLIYGIEELHDHIRERGIFP